MGLKSVLGERFHDFGDKTSIAGLNNAVHSKSNGKSCVPSLLYHTEVIIEKSCGEVFLIELDTIEIVI